VPDDGDEITMPLDLEAEDGEPVIGVVEGDPFDAAYQGLDFRICDGHERIIHGFLSPSLL